MNSELPIVGSIAALCPPLSRLPHFESSRLGPGPSLQELLERAEPEGSAAVTVELECPPSSRAGLSSGSDRVGLRGSWVFGGRGWSALVVAAAVVTVVVGLGFAA